MEKRRNSLTNLRLGLEHTIDTVLLFLKALCVAAYGHYSWVNVLGNTVSIEASLFIVVACMDPPDVERTADDIASQGCTLHEHAFRRVVTFYHYVFVWPQTVCRVPHAA